MMRICNPSKHAVLFFLSISWAVGCAAEVGSAESAFDGDGLDGRADHAAGSADTLWKAMTSETLASDGQGTEISYDVHCEYHVDGELSIWALPVYSGGAAIGFGLAPARWYSGASATSLSDWEQLIGALPEEDLVRGAGSVDGGSFYVDRSHVDPSASSIYHLEVVFPGYSEKRLSTEAEDLLTRMKADCANLIATDTPELFP